MRSRRNERSSISIKYARSRLPQPSNIVNEQRITTSMLISSRKRIESEIRDAISPDALFVQVYWFKPVKVTNIPDTAYFIFTEER